MADDVNRPNATDPGASGAGASGGAAEVRPSGDKPNGSDPVLSFLKETTGRDFASIDEAKKSVQHLNSMVGDKSISEMKKRAELGETFEKVVKGYAKENGMSAEAARADLLALMESEDGGKNGDGKSTQQATPEAAKIAELEQRLDLADLLKAHPESANVLDDLRDLAKARGTTLQATYEASKLLQGAAKAAAASNSKDGLPSSVTPSNRLSATDRSRALEDAQSAFEKDRSEKNANALVAAALGLRKG